MLKPAISKAIKKYGLHSVEISTLKGTHVVCMSCDKSPASVASMMKMPIGLVTLKEMERRGLTLDTPITIYPDIVDDTEDSRNYPRQVTLRKALDTMLHGAEHSNTYANNLAVFASGQKLPANTSARQLLSAITQPLNEKLAASGLKHTKFVNFLNVKGDHEEALNRSTLADISKTLQLLSTGNGLGFDEARKSLETSRVPFGIPLPPDISIIRKKSGWNIYATGVTYLIKAPNGEQYIVALAKNQPKAFEAVSGAASEINQAISRAS